MTSFQLQQTLTLVGIGLLVAAAGLVAVAAYMYFKFNIPDIYADISGKKRAEGIARKMAEQASGRQRGRSEKARKSERTLAAGAATGSFGTGALGATSGSISSRPSTGSSSSDVGNDGPAARQQSAKKASRSENRPIPQAPEDATTVMADDDGATTVLSADEEATTVIGAEDVAPASEDAAPESPRTVDATSVSAEPESPIEDSPATVSLAEEQQADAKDVAEGPSVPEYFHIVQRIVLTESTDFVRVERGESHE